jgi:ABC-type branched-subunit amino acid transport system ATPase component
MTHAQAPNAEADAALAGRETVLAVDSLSVTYGGVRAVNGFSVTLHAGEVCGLIGPNGAGKTSAVDAITGFVRPSGGSITLLGQDVTHRRPHERARHGLTRTFQALDLFDDLSVWENVDISVPIGGDADDVTWALDLVGIGHLAEHSIHDLSFGERRLVAFARGIVGKPRALLLDEPAAGLDSHETAELATAIRRLVEEENFAVLLIDHDMNLVIGVCDWIEVIDFGAPLASGTPATITSNPDVIRAYVGAA